MLTFSINFLINKIRNTKLFIDSYNPTFFSSLPFQLFKNKLIKKFATQRRTLSKNEIQIIKTKLSKSNKNIGSILIDRYQPHKNIHNPLSQKHLTLSLLLSSQVHIGHSTSLWNVATHPYIYGIRQGIHIINLDTTITHLRRACAVISGIAAKRGIILFVGTQRNQKDCIIKAAKRANGFHVFDRWIPGTITNRHEVLKHGKMKKSSIIINGKKITRNDERIYHFSALPDLVICLNPIQNKILLHECAKAHIPTIGIIDTDADPKYVTYPVPCNDDSLRSVEMIVGILSCAAENAKVKENQK
ncbi:ribosomal protein S2 [Pneumocystis carinii B80]|uniref:Ribosomal protein S2 n=1 Tax=Pneumocystis carinii (strain B80) TaxID=1408658 RepID=A0A0W4ZLD4_PNEC8|nr:ribosomal protein S2 [Pneumocystis carinii B80]KTW29193.1 ribosomal protein S2 [Pneumocystis carinii B80]